VKQRPRAAIISSTSSDATPSTMAAATTSEALNLLPLDAILQVAETEFIVMIVEAGLIN